MQKIKEENEGEQTSNKRTFEPSYNEERNKITRLLKENNPIEALNTINK